MIEFEREWLGRSVAFQVRVSDIISFWPIDSLPEDTPDVVRNIWTAALEYYDSGPRYRLTREQAARRAYISPRTFDRARKKYPDLLPWPIRRGDRPPWEANPDLFSNQRIDQERTMIEVRQTGRVVALVSRTHIKRLLQLSMLGSLIEGDA
jgi:hypothetical protein